MNTTSCPKQEGGTLKTEISTKHTKGEIKTHEMAKLQENAEMKTTVMLGMLVDVQSRRVRPRAEREWWSEKHKIRKHRKAIGNTEKVLEIQKKKQLETYKSVGNTQKCQKIGTLREAIIRKKILFYEKVS